MTPYDQLSEEDKEADRCIGSAIWGDCLNEHSSAIAAYEFRAQHLYEPFTCRDGNRACRRCYGSEHSDNHYKVDKDLVEHVEELIGSGSAAWDTVNPIELCHAVLRAAQHRVDMSLVARREAAMNDGDDDQLCECEKCGGSGEVTTRDCESYFGAQMKPCPKCSGVVNGLGHGKLS